MHGSIGKWKLCDCLRDCHAHDCVAMGWQVVWLPVAFAADPTAEARERKSFRCAYQRSMFRLCNDHSAGLRVAMTIVLIT